MKKKLFNTLLLLFILISCNVYASNITDDFSVSVSFDDESNIILINGEINILKNKIISAKAIYNGENEDDDADNTVGFSQVLCNEDGSFLIEMPLGKDALSGWYTINIGGQFSVIGDTSSFVYNMYFMNDDSFYAAMKEINDTSGGAEIPGIFKNNTYLGYSLDEKTADIFYNLKVEKGGFDLTSTVEMLKKDLDDTMRLAKIINSINSDADKEESLLEAAKLLGIDETEVDNCKTEMARILSEGNLSADNKAKLKTLMEEVLVLAQINNATYDGLSDILIQNKDILGISIDKYVTMNKVTVNKKLVRKNFNSLETFKQAYDAAILAVINAGSGNSGNSGGSGGSGGGRNVSTGTSVAITPQTPNAIPSETNVDKESPFNDLDNASWAKESIINLYNKQIISGKNDKEFCPNDYITREEFVTLVVKAFGKYNANAVSNFTDVDEKMWYAPYTASAKEAGIVSGNQDGSFGIGTLIKREDMAVILYRVAESDINSNVSNEINFKDYEDISDYAKDAVVICNNAGIISGMGESTFAPKENATRAQAARMIEMLMKEVEK